MLKALQNRQFSKKPFLISYILILGIILIIGVTLYYATYRQVKSGTHRQNRQALSAAVTEMDSAFALMGAASRQASSDRELRQLSKLTPLQEPMFFYQAYNTQASLKSMTPVELLLPTANSYLYMFSSNYIISSTRFGSLDSYILKDAGCEIPAGELQAMFRDQRCWNKLFPLQPERPDPAGCLYLCPSVSFDASSKENKAIMCYEITTAGLEQIFAGLNRYKTGYLAVFDKNGSQMLLLSESGADADNELLSGLDYVDSVASLTDDEGTRMLVTRAVSDYNGWQYYLVQPENSVYYSISVYQRIFTISTVAALGVGGMIAAVSLFMGNRRFARLSNELSATASMNTSLNLLVQKQKSVVIETYMRRIMEGSITTDEEMQRIISELSLDRQDIKFHVLYTEVSPSEVSSIRSADMELAIQNYDMLVREALRRYYPDTGYIYKPSDRVFAILIASGREEPSEYVVNRDSEIFTALHKELLENYGIWIRGGLGMRNSLISYTWKSYQQAKDAKSMTTTDNYILSSADFAQSTDVYYFPDSLSVQLSGFISTGSREQVNELFKLIRKENTIRRSLSYTQQRWLISDVRSTLFKKRHSIATGDLDNDRLKILDIIDHQFDDEMSLASLNTIAVQLCDVCGDSSEGNKLILKIQEYINNNYPDPNLGLARISDEFGISENYFSYLFKKEVSENFSTYLERLRMAKAREMIIDSDAGLSTLYQRLGYNNAASFRRAFKKNFGMSPKEMRDSINADTK